MKNVYVVTMEYPVSDTESQKVPYRVFATEKAANDFAEFENKGAYYYEVHEVEFIS